MDQGKEENAQINTAKSGKGYYKFIPCDKAFNIVAICACQPKIIGRFLGRAALLRNRDTFMCFRTHNNSPSSLSLLPAPPPPN